MARLFALLTDYGYTDTYVAQVKAVLLRLCPTCEVLDLTHGIPPQQVRSGAYQLATAVPYLPDGTVLIAVVDPGVGTARRAIGVQGTRHIYFAPDNGLLSLALLEDPPQRAVVLDNPRYHLPEVSATFHGRDIFAPCAAHFANGVPLEQLGTPTPPDTLTQLPHLTPIREAEGFVCHPLHIDHFGNVVFNLRRAVYARATQRSAPDRVYLSRAGTLVELPMVRTFGEVPWGTPLAYWGSSDYLEVAINGGSAARQLGVDFETTVRVPL